MPKNYILCLFRFFNNQSRRKIFRCINNSDESFEKIYYYFHICNFKRVPSYLGNFLHYETMIQSIDEKLWRVHMMNEVSRDYFQQDFPSTQKNC